MWHYHSFHVLTDVKWKTCSPSYFSSLAMVVYSLSLCLSLSISLSLSFCLSFCLSVCLSLLCVCFYETNFPYKRGHSIAHSILKTCAQQRKDHLGLFLNINNLEEEGKMLIKLIVVDSNHFIRYKSNITIIKEYFSVEVTHNLLITWMNNTPPKSFSLNFIHFKYWLNRLMFRLWYQCHSCHLVTAFPYRITIQQ